MDLSDDLAGCVTSHEEALGRLVTSGTRIGSGLGTSEPHTFYSSLWDHVRDADLHDLTISNGLFLAAHPILVGDEIAAARASGGDGPDEAEPDGVVEELFARARGFVRQTVDKVTDLRHLVSHLDELQERRIVFHSGFMGPATNTVIPDLAPVRALLPSWAGRNASRTGNVRMHPVHFSDAGESLVRDPHTGEMKVDLVVSVLSEPRDGEFSFGASNGVNGDVLDLGLDGSDVHFLMYVNARSPFVRGFDFAPNTVGFDRLRAAAAEGRLTIVEDDGRIPAVPAGSFSGGGGVAADIGKAVSDHIADNAAWTGGRALQVGIGETGVQAVRGLGGSDWTGRVYTELLDPLTWELLQNGTITGSHIVRPDGTRLEVDDAIVCTFALGEEGTDFYDQLDDNDQIRMASARHILRESAFHGGMGINNVLALDFMGNINVSARDTNWYSGTGGTAVIHRGLAQGGVAYLCAKSTHKTPEGETRSSIFPFLPQGSPVSLTGPDIMGTRDGAKFFLATEHGIAPINARSQDQFIQSIVSVSHPDHREGLEKAAWEQFRVRC